MGASAQVDFAAVMERVQSVIKTLNLMIQLSASLRLESNVFRVRRSSNLPMKSR